jgi:hypothetical protein
VKFSSLPIGRLYFLAGFFLLLAQATAFSQQQPNRSLFAPSISEDGRFISFITQANNLSKTNLDVGTSTFDVYVYDRLRRYARISTVRSNVTYYGGSVISEISADGEWVVFHNSNMGPSAFPGDINNAADIFVSRARARYNSTYQEVNTDMALVSRSTEGVIGNHVSWYPSISANGRFVAFMSMADNLTSLSDTNQSDDVFWHDRDADEDGIFDEYQQPGGIRTELCSKTISGTAGNRESGKPRISGDGHSVVFASDATNLVAGDINQGQDIFLWKAGFNNDLSTVTRVHSVNFGSSAYDSAVNHDGSIIGYRTGSSYIKRQPFTTSIEISRRYNDTSAGSMVYGVALDGRGDFGAFSTSDSQIIETGDTNVFRDVFLRNLTNNTTILVSRTPAGTSPNGNSGSSDLDDRSVFVSETNRYIVFESLATNLGFPDTNGVTDIYIYDRQSNTMDMVWVDVTPPSWPPNAQIQGIPGHRSIALQWPAASDNNAVEFYEIMRGVGTVQVSGTRTNAVVTGLNPSTSYPTRIRAVDYAGSEGPWITNTFMTLAAPPDSDGDGMPNSWEALYPTASLPNVDSDLDGETNLEEYAAGTNPTNVLSNFRRAIVLFQVTDAVHLSVQTQAERVYEIESNEDLTGADAWQQRASQLGSGGVMIFDVPKGEKSMFIRLMVTPY